MKCKLLVVTLLYATMTSASTTENQTSLEKRITQNQTHISTLSQNIKSGNTNVQPPAPAYSGVECCGNSCNRSVTHAS